MSWAADLTVCSSSVYHHRDGRKGSVSLDPDPAARLSQCPVLSTTCYIRLVILPAYEPALPPTVGRSGCRVGKWGRVDRPLALLEWLAPIEF